MGWFFETENDRREKRIIAYAETICGHMRNITNRYDRDGGINYNNIDFITSETSAMVPAKEKMETEIMQLPQSRMNTLCLPWVDGRKIPFSLWANCYQMGAMQLQRMINSF